MMQICRAEIIELSPHLREYERASSNCHEVNSEAGGKVLYPRTREALTLLSTRPELFIATRISTYAVLVQHNV